MITRWISGTEAARAAYEATKTPEPLSVMTRDEIAAVVESLADLPGLLSAADLADKAAIYAGIGLRLTYQTEPRSVLAEVRFGDQPNWCSESVRGATEPQIPMHPDQRIHNLTSLPIGWSGASPPTQESLRTSPRGARRFRTAPALAGRGGILRHGTGLRDDG